MLPSLPERGKLRRDANLVLITAIVLTLLGIIFIYSATYVRLLKRGFSPFLYVRRQVIFFAFALVAFWIASRFNVDLLEDFAFMLYGLGLAGLVLVLFFGKTGGGAQRWFAVGPFYVQPSLFMKVIWVIFLAHRLGRAHRPSWREFLEVLFWAGLIILPTALQPDLGTAILFFAVALVILYLSGVPLVAFAHLIFWSTVLSPMIWAILRPYQRRRILAFLNPQVYKHGAAYHSLQSQIAIGSGGIFGVGLFKGIQKSLMYIPAQHTDFIFSVIGEEVGFVGSAVVILLYALIIMKTLSVASRIENRYRALLVGGVAVTWMFQVFVNIGMNLGILPVTGIPLPFMSYGGSDLLANYLGLALVFSAVRMEERKRGKNL